MTSFLPSATIQRLADKNQSIKQMLKPLTVNNLQHYEYIYIVYVSLCLSFPDLPTTDFSIIGLI